MELVHGIVGTSMQKVVCPCWCDVEDGQVPLLKLPRERDPDLPQLI